MCRQTRISVFVGPIGQRRGSMQQWPASVLTGREKLAGTHLMTPTDETEAFNS